MRSFTALWLPAVAALAQAALPSGHIYFYDQESRTSTQHHHAVDAKTAALILASRFGVSQYHDLGLASDESLVAINAFGHQKKLFAQSASRPPQALLLATSGDDLDESYDRTLEVSAMPGRRPTNDLLNALEAQKQAILSTETYDSNSSGDIVVRSEDQTIDSLRALGYDVIVVVTPEKTTSSSTYGRIVKPSTMHKRQAEFALEDFPTWTTTVDVDSAFSSQADDSSNDTSPLAGILPACYSSKSACESTTRNCTGHGSCTLAYTQRDSTGDSEGTPCYQCACTPSVVRNSEGQIKTTTWAGPACQKKDVSVPFWLLGGFAVFMVFLVSWGVGTLFSMGEEELPSVIGAGVSGPTKK